MKKNTFLLLLGLCITIKTINSMETQNRGYHWDPKLAQQLYIENGCEVCGDLGPHPRCNNIGSAVKQDMKNFLSTICMAISTYGYPSLIENFTDRILESEIRSSLHPYTLKAMHDRFGADQVSAHLKRTGKQALLNYLKKRKKFMDDQLIPGDKDYDTIYVALARKIHILHIAIEILENRLPYSIWSLKIGDHD